jgi:hypothetical protein
MIFIPPCRGKEPINRYTIEDQSPGDNQFNRKMNIIFFSRGSRACRHASPRCVDLHLMVRRLIGSPHPSSPRAPQEPTTSEIAQ